jgi:formate dehydrogenase maturation protein FdhE
VRSDTHLYLSNRERSARIVSAALSYTKSLDLTKNGHAVPVVDELATVALNIWAEEHDYAKLEPNLLGM